MILLSIHYSPVLRGDGLLPDLAKALERPIPRVAEPVDALPNAVVPFHRVRTSIHSY